jgi:ArsR family transcriptional regulator, arsenate/arsenite/antimonite-responsive transcriptional repressor
MAAKKAILKDQNKMKTKDATLPEDACRLPLECGRLPSGASGRIDLAFRAFSDRTRLRILHVLREGELCVGDIVDALLAPQPRISRHLAYLRKANLVAVRKSGLWCHYSLAPAKSPFHRKLLECLAKCFSEVPELQADSARAAKIRHSGGCCPNQ